MDLPGHGAGVDAGPEPGVRPDQAVTAVERQLDALAREQQRA